MTIDEAIKHAEEVAEDKEIDIENQDSLFPNNIKECKECAEEHRQLAEWLKELKRLREQTRWIPVRERYPEDGQRVLVDYCDEDMGIMLMRFNVNGYRGFKGWMPLPESYKASLTEAEKGECNYDYGYRVRF